MNESTIQMLNKFVLSITILSMYIRHNLLEQPKNITSSHRSFLVGTELFSVLTKKFFSQDNQDLLIFISLTQNRNPEIGTLLYHLPSGFLCGVTDGFFYVLLFSLSSLCKNELLIIFTDYFVFVKI